MIPSMPEQPHKLDPWVFIGRALRLRCPECGVTALFKPWRQTRSLFDWFTPLDGCPRCGYVYEREQGYFLLSIWALNYGLIAGSAVIVSFALDILWSPPMWAQIAFVFAPMPVLSLAFVRHSKSLFLALDHYCDPHVKPSDSPPADRSRDPNLPQPPPDGPSEVFVPSERMAR
jgi:uncharacterized protein (DUF983 family)